MEIIAHRGASSAGEKNSMENTLAAFDAAHQRGADGLEFDVRLAACGTPVIIHDETLTRTLGIPTRVDALEATELEALGVPLLATVLWRYAGEMRLFIEAKTREAAIASAVQMELLRKSGSDAASLILIAFDHEALAEAKSLFPGIVTGASFDTPPAPLQACSLPCAPDWLAVRADCITARTVTESLQANLRLAAWTVNDAKQARRLHLLGVDAVITDRPQEAREWLL